MGRFSNIRFDTGDPRRDASESIFLQRQLVHVRAAPFNVLYPQLKGRELVPMATEQPHRGATITEYKIYDHVGKSKVGGSYSSDGPRVDVFATDSSSPIHPLKDSYGINVQEVQAAMMAGIPLSTLKSQAARTVIETDLDTIIFSGYSDIGLTGLLNISSTVTYTTPVGDGGLKTWESKTSDEIIADMTGIDNQIWTDSGEVEMADTLLLPSTSYALIKARRMGDGDSTTIYNHFLSVSDRIKNIFASGKCETAGTASSKRMVCYKRDPSKIALIMPLEFEQLAPEPRGYEVVTQCHARTGGVVAYYPKSVGYGDYI